MIWFFFFYTVKPMELSLWLKQLSEQAKISVRFNSLKNITHWSQAFSDIAYYHRCEKFNTPRHSFKTHLSLWRVPYKKNTPGYVIMILLYTSIRCTWFAQRRTAKKLILTLLVYTTRTRNSARMLMLQTLPLGTTYVVTIYLHTTKVVI
jgi:hypothetical protein